MYVVLSKVLAQVASFVPVQHISTHLKFASPHSLIPSLSVSPSSCLPVSLSLPLSLPPSLPPSLSPPSVCLFLYPCIAHRWSLFWLNITLDLLQFPHISVFTIPIFRPVFFFQVDMSSAMSFEETCYAQVWGRNTQSFMLNCCYSICTTKNLSHKYCTVVKQFLHVLISFSYKHTVCQQKRRCM